MMQRAPAHFLIGTLLMGSLAACDSGASSAGKSATESATSQNPRTTASVAMPTTSAPAIKQGLVKEAVAHALQTQYAAGYDEANRCWRTERGEGDQATAYCMRPLPEQVVRQGDTTWVYVALASASDIRNNPDYLYGHVDAGVMDALKLRISGDGKSEVVAQGLGLSFGSAGDCGCTNAKFVQIGPHTHGWQFTSGGTWQGTTVASHALVAPVGHVFKDVAALPRYVEGDQSVEYRLAIVDADPATDWYPLRLTRVRDGRSDDEYVIRFDPDTSRYPIPRDV